MLSIVLKHPGAKIYIDELGNDKRRIRVDLLDKSEVIAFESCETSYPVDLIQQILKVKGLSHLCDEIMRDENPSYVQRILEQSILGYVDKSIFSDKAILDFGCGCGSSTMVLARLFPGAKIIGVDIADEFISIARDRAEHHAFSNVTFYVSPTPDKLPEEMDCFDFVVMSAVYEHLLPKERKIVLPLVWSSIKKGGILFINQTPYRWFPVETHTTGLPLINYLPDRLTHNISRKFCGRIKANESWETLLRRGIRGASLGEILEIIRVNCNERPILLEPCRRGFRDRIDLWHALSSSSRFPKVKRSMKVLFKIIKFATGVEFLPSLSLAIKKHKSHLK